MILHLIKTPFKPKAKTLPHLRSKIDQQRERLWIPYPQLITFINSQLGLAITDIGQLTSTQCVKVLTLLAGMERKGTK